VAVDASGNVYVADWLNDRIQKFNSSLVYVDTIGSSGTADGQLNNPGSITIDIA
jgi:DNA-binding beta-propeller fold protein YncE